MTEIFPGLRPDEEERQGAAVQRDAFGPAPPDDNSVAQPDEALRRSEALPDEARNAVPAVARWVFAVSRREQKRPTEQRQQDAAPQACPAELALKVEAERPDAAQLAEHRLVSRQLQEQWLPEQLRALPQLEREQADVRQTPEPEPKPGRQDEPPRFQESQGEVQASPSHPVLKETPRAALRRQVSQQRPQEREQQDVLRASWQPTLSLASQLRQQPPSPPSRGNACAQVRHARYRASLSAFSFP